MTWRMATRQMISRIISVEETKKLTAIRDEIGEIKNLDKLYEDRPHKNGLPFHVYVPKHLKAGPHRPDDRHAQRVSQGSLVAASPFLAPDQADVRLGRMTAMAAPARDQGRIPSMK
jgi:hypothetical protein